MNVFIPLMTHVVVQPHRTPSSFVLILSHSIVVYIGSDYVIWIAVIYMYALIKISFHDTVGSTTGMSTS